MTVTLEEQVRCVERELGFRSRVSARRVAAEQMTQAKADQEIAAMEAVLATVNEAAAKERLI